jgi:hypothetical protein
LLTYFRSSSVAAWRMCEWKYHLAYTLGLEDLSGIAAHKGNAVHKALELGARCQAARQRLEPTFSEEETGITWETATFDYDKAMDVGYEHYRAGATHLKWSEKDRDECRKWMWQALNWMGGLYNPLNRRVVQPEQFFELDLPFDWAQTAAGPLKMMGTIDLLLEAEHEPDALELVDWKTGRRWDWATGEEKTYQKLLNDHQLLMYYYAVRRLYPDKKLYVTIVWVKDGGPYTIPFAPKDVNRTEQILRETYEQINSTPLPDRALDSKCRFCHFAKAKHQESGKTVCDHVYGEVVNLGLSKVVDKYQKGETKGYVGGGRGH